jgi:hypothetical protein
MSTGRVLTICPSRDRPGPLKRLIASFLKTSTHARLVVVIDSDQQEMYSERDYGERVSFVVKDPPKAGPIACYNGIWSCTPAEVYGALLDDCEFETDGWDDYCLEARDRFPGRVGLISPWTNVKDPGGVVTEEMDYVQFMFITKEWGGALGYFAYPKCIHYCWDTVLEVLADSTSIERVPKEKFTISHHSLLSESTRLLLPHDTYEAIMFMATQRRQAISRLKKAMAR